MIPRLLWKSHRANCNRFCVILLTKGTRVKKQYLVSYRPHSIILASCKPLVENLVYDKSARIFNLLSNFFVENLVAMQQVRWFARVLDKWNVVKTRFAPANKTVEAGFLLCILLFLECTDLYRLISPGSSSGNRVLCAPYLSVSGILFNPRGVFPFLIVC